LWSIFEFLNPGLLGSATVFPAARGCDEPSRRRHAGAPRQSRPAIRAPPHQGPGRPRPSGQTRATGLASHRLEL